MRTPTQTRQKTRRIAVAMPACEARGAGTAAQQLTKQYGCLRIDFKGHSQLSAHQALRFAQNDLEDPRKIDRGDGASHHCKRALGDNPHRSVIHPSMPAIRSHAGRKQGGAH